MKPVIDTEKEYGLVLEGGGARGAYQIGAWKALQEAGIKIKGVAGTSVGALNGALICMDDVEAAVRIWEEITYSKVMEVDDERMKAFFQKELKLTDALKDFFHFVGDGGADVTPLRKLIEEVLEEDKIRASGIEFFLLTFSITEMKELDLSIDDIPRGQLQDFLMASAYLFLFKNEALHGKKYMDGGIINNVPLESLVNRGYKDIISLRIFGPGREKKVKLTEDIVLYSVEPRVNLGNIIDFHPDKSKRNMKIGYYDALRLLYGLKGFIYYIDIQEEECYYLRKLTKLNEDAIIYISRLYGQKEETSVILRRWVEQVLPAAARELKLDKNWTYTDLYIAALEATAKLLKVPKYHVYTEKELTRKVKSRGKAREESDILPPFSYIITLQQ